MQYEMQKQIKILNIVDNENYIKATICPPKGHEYIDLTEVYFIQSQVKNKYDYMTDWDNQPQNMKMK